MAAIFATTRYATIDDLLDGFHAAAARSDLNTWCGCFHAESSRFLGTDVSENWTARQAHDEFAPYFAKSSCAWKYDPIHGSRKINMLSHLENKVAVFDEALRSESFLCTSRGNGTLVLCDGCWFIAQYFLSFHMPNDLAKTLCRTIAEFESEQAASSLLADEEAAKGGQKKQPKAGKGKVGK